MCTIIDDNENYFELRCLIARNGYTNNSFSRALGVNKSTLSDKIGGKRHFTQDEIYKICDILKINYKDISTYFPPRATMTQRKKMKKASESFFRLMYKKDDEKRNGKYECYRIETAIREYKTLCLTPETEWVEMYEVSSKTPKKIEVYYREAVKTIEIF